MGESVTSQQISLETLYGRASRALLDGTAVGRLSPHGSWVLTGQSCSLENEAMADPSRSLNSLPISRFQFSPDKVLN